MDADIYTITELPQLLGVLCHIIDVTLAALKDHGPGTVALAAG